MKYRRQRNRRHEPPEVVDPPPVAGRVPPHDLDAEASVLSACMLDRGACETATLMLKPEMFYSEANARIFQAIRAIMVAVDDKQRDVDVVSVVTWLRDREWLQKIGGSAYVAMLADATPAIGHVETHAKTVIEKWKKRSLIALAQRIFSEGYGDVGEFKEWAVGHAEAIDAMVRDEEPNAGLQHVGVSLKESFQKIADAAERGERVTGIATGYDRFDEQTAGMQAGDLIIVAARPGMGKAQTIDSKVLTPTGWRAIGSLCVGEVVSGPWGLSQKVVGVFPQGKKNVFAVRVDGNRQTRCCDEHLWFAAIARPTDAYRDRLPMPRLYTTLQLRSAMTEGWTVMLPVSEDANNGGWPEWREVDGIESDGEAECVCIAVDSPSHLYVTDDFIVTHNTSFVFNVAVNVASPKEVTSRGVTVVEPGIGVCAFSLEMPREQLAQRMACSEGRVDLLRVRKAILQNEDWRKLTEAGGYLSTLPIWIDDTPGISVMEIRAKVRRQMAVYNREATDTQPARKVGLVLVDYLQLMKGSGDTQSREQEISEISRGLKGLAKELKMPVVALSQLNRAVETRSTKDKRPQLSDLRECVTGDTVVIDAVTGLSVTVAEIAAGKQVTTYALKHVSTHPLRHGRPESNWRLTVAPIASAWSTGVKPVFRLRTKTGRVLRATANHPLRAIDGWKELGKLKAGEWIAVYTGDIAIWDEVASIDPCGEEEVFDLSVPGVHNFVANGIFAHNSGAIEQDADTIVFLYRDEYYHEDSDKKGIAELIIGKQRNGPPGKVYVRFEASCTRFDNLKARDYPVETD